jgi:hypothetical protein
MEGWNTKGPNVDDIVISALTEVEEPHRSLNLYYLWWKWAKDKSLHKIFWWHVASRDEGISLSFFLDQMSSKYGRYVHLIHHSNQMLGIMGAFWLYDIHLPHHLSAGIWLDFRFRGLQFRDEDMIAAVPIAQYALDWIGDIYKPQHLFMYSPWADAVALANRLEIPVVAQIEHATELTRKGTVYVMRKDY